MRFDWDPSKNRGNRQKHGLGFEIAQRVFGDPLAVSKEDDEPYEERWLTMGRIDNVVVIVAHGPVEEDPHTGEEIVRLISARKATAHERRAYEEGDF